MSDYFSKYLDLVNKEKNKYRGAGFIFYQRNAYGYTTDFDVLSIDIDSTDYQIWKSLKIYTPKIVIIEINSSVNTDNREHIHTKNIYQGTGFKPTFDLGLEKGYTFILHTGNMIFIRNDLFNKLNINYNNPLENFRTTWGAS